MSTSFLIGTFFVSLLGLLTTLLSNAVAFRNKERRKIRKALEKDTFKAIEKDLLLEAEHLGGEEDLKKKKSDSSSAGDPKKKGEDAERFQEIRDILNRAEILLARKNFSDAEQLFIKILAFEANHLVAMQKLAYLYLQTESYPKAENLYRQLQEITPKSPGVCTNLGLALFQQKKFEECIECYKQAIDLEPHHAARYANLGQVLFVMKDFEAALECFEQAVKKDSRNINFLYLLADTCLEAKHFKDAKKWYSKILDLSPYDEDAKEEVRRLKALGF